MSDPTETDRLVAAAILAGVIPAPLRPGDRIEVLVGGYANDTGRVTAVEPDPAGGLPWLSLALDTGWTLSGYRPGQLRRASRCPHDRQ